MIGHALIRFPEGGEISREDWEAFCAPLEIVYAPQAVGLNVYYHGGKQGVECAFGIGSRGAASKADGPPDRAEQVVFTTIWGGARKQDLAGSPGCSGCGSAGRCSLMRRRARRSVRVTVSAPSMAWRGHAEHPDTGGWRAHRG